MARALSRDELLSFTLGAMSLSTGGGGVRPVEGKIEQKVDEALSQGKEFKLAKLEEIPEDALVLAGIGTGGGISVEQRMRWMTHPGFYATSGGFLRTGFEMGFINDQIKLKNTTFAPLNSWSELPGPSWEDAGLNRLKEILGDKEIYSFLPLEINQMLIRKFLTYPDRGWPILDATGCGHRAVPEFSITSLNIHDVPVCPAVFTTTWGDLLVLEKTLSWQRAEEIIEGISTYSGGDTGGIMAVEGRVIKRTVMPGAVSFTLKIGQAMKKAVETGDDPVEAMIEASGGLAHKIFEGKVIAHLFEEKYSFIWGYNLLKGTGDWKDRQLKIWYKNENHISWLDEKPYITSPDGLNIIDPETGWGLSNFWTAEWEYGREVSVIGVKAEDLWRTEKGLRLLGPKHFDFDIPYKPIEEIII